MVIEPFNYQKRTNIEEHNQIVDKLNEVVDAVNNIDPNPSEFEQRIDALEQSAINQQNAIDGIHTRDALQDTEISSIKGKVTVNTNNIEQLETNTTSLDGRVTDIDGRLTTLAGNYTTLSQSVGNIDSEVGQMSTKVGSLETGKVNIAQGTENAGKYLKVGTDGNLTPDEISAWKVAKIFSFSSNQSEYVEFNFTVEVPSDKDITFKIVKGSMIENMGGMVFVETPGFNWGWSCDFSVNTEDFNTWSLIVNKAPMGNYVLLYNLSNKIGENRNVYMESIGSAKTSYVYNATVNCTWNNDRFIIDTTQGGDVFVTADSTDRSYLVCTCIFDATTNEYFFPVNNAWLKGTKYNNMWTIFVDKTPSDTSHRFQARVTVIT